MDKEGAGEEHLCLSLGEAKADRSNRPKRPAQHPVSSQRRS